MCCLNLSAHNINLSADQTIQSEDYDNTSLHPPLDLIYYTDPINRPNHPQFYSQS